MVARHYRCTSKFSGDGTVLYLDCDSGSNVTVYIVKTLGMYAKKGGFYHT